jgi:predicted nucleic acid-binding protein
MLMIRGASGITGNRADFRLLGITPAVAERAAHLRAKYNIKAPDALQVASAIEAGCEAFLTHDFGLRRITDIKVVIVGELELDTDQQEQDKNSDG